MRGDLIRHFRDETLTTGTRFRVCMAGMGTGDLPLGLA